MTLLTQTINDILMVLWHFYLFMFIIFKGFSYNIHRYFSVYSYHTISVSHRLKKGQAWCWSEKRALLTCKPCPKRALSFA